MRGESGQELQDLNQSSGCGYQDLEPSHHLNSTNVDWIMQNNADNDCADEVDDQQTIMYEGLDLEEGNSWLNWDLFLEDVNNSTDMT